MGVSILGEAAIRLRPNAEGFSEEAQVGIVGPLKEVAGKAAGMFAAAFAAEKVGDFLKESVTQYSDLNESVSKAGVVFGDYSKQVDAFASTAAAKMGLSTQQAEEAAGTFGNLAVSLGLSQKQSAGMSTSLVKLGGDLASFNNTDPAEALDALRSGLTGETEPLKRFGININDAALKAQALKMGLDTTGPTLSANTKAQAAYALIMAQSATAQGDFLRTSGGLANQTRIMSAEFKDLQSNVGGALYPFVQLGAQGITKVLLPSLLNATSGLKDFGTTAEAGLEEFESSARAAFGGAKVAGDTFATSVGGTLGRWASDAQGDWSVFTDAAKGGGVGMLGAENSIAGVLSRTGANLHLFQQNAVGAFMGLRTQATEAVAPLAADLAPTWATIKAAVGQVLDPTGTGLSGSGSKLFGFLNGLVGKITPIISGWITAITPMLSSLLPMIGNAVAGIIPVVSGLFAQLGPIIGQLLPVIAQVAGFWQHVLMGAFEQLIPILPVIVGAIGQLVGTLAGALRPILRMIGPIITTVATALQGALVTAIKALVPILPVLAGILGDVAKMLAGALVTAIEALLPILPPIISALSMIAQAVMGAVMQALQALLPLIPQIVNLFVQLVRAALVPLLPLLPMLAQLLATIITALAPLLPLVVQVVALLIQLAISAMLPLLPVIQMLIRLAVGLIGALMPIVQVLLTIIGGFIRFGSVIAGVVIGFVTRVIGLLGSLVAWFVSIPTRILGAIGDLGTLLFSQGVKLIQGLVNGISSAASFVGNIGRNIVNAIIGFINSHVIDGINNLLDFTIAGIHINPPNIPHIPRLHEGGVFDVGSGNGGEGLALLRNQELVVTPEQRVIADSLLRDLIAGNLPTAPAAPAEGAGLVITNYITQQPGESGPQLAARVTDRLTYNLNNGVTATVGAGVPR